MNETPTLITDYQRRLDDLSTEKTRDWWFNYMKQVIPFRGVGIPENRSLLAEWRKEHGLGDWSPDQQLKLAVTFLHQSHAEDKLAGILYLQEYLIGITDPNMVLDQLEDVFDQEYIFDWNICDWCCVKVLGPLIEAHGETVAIRIASWSKAGYLWKARAGLVGFVYQTADVEFHPLVLDSASILIARPERFAKTAVGWVLRELSKTDPEAVVAFINDHRKDFSTESLKNAIKKLDSSMISHLP